MPSPQFDTELFINTIFIAAVSAFFGSILGSIITHYLQRQRDDVAWRRNNEQLQRQLDHARELAEFQVRVQLYHELGLSGGQRPESKVAHEAAQELEAFANIQHIVDQLKGRPPSEIRITAGK
jgi:hypothetical protein